MELRVDCPFCRKRKGSQDTKRHLYINPGKGAHCFRCGFATRRLEWLSGVLQLQLAVATPDAPPPAVQLPKEYSTDWQTPLGRLAWGYLQYRQLSPALIAAYQIGYCATGAYSQRIIIPILEDGVLRTFVARDWTNRQPLRYRRPPGATATFYNWDRVRHQDVILLTEGCFDVLALPQYAVGLLGKQLQPAQRAALLRQPTLHTVLIALDADADRDAAVLYRTLAGCIPCVRHVHLRTDLSAASATERALLTELCEESHRVSRARTSLLRSACSPNGTVPDRLGSPPPPVRSLPHSATG
jgi:hypothetical protein